MSVWRVDLYAVIPLRLVEKDVVVDRTSWVIAT